MKKLKLMEKLILFVCICFALFVFGCSSPSTSAPVLSNTSSTPKATPSPTPVSPNKYTSGQYKVGSDIEPGIYMALSNSGDSGDPGYFAVTSDANGHNILFNDLFTNHSFFEVREGEYLELSMSYALAYEEAPSLDAIDGILPAGMYIVGEHLAAGEYKLTATDDFGYYAIYNDARHQNIISNSLFEGSNYVTVTDGQFLLLSGSELAVDN